MTQSGSSSGLGGGRASGQRPFGSAGKTDFKRDKLNPSGLQAGQPVGVLTVDGPSLKGEVSLPKGGARRDAVQRLSQEVEKEALPIQYRTHVRRYHDFVLQGGQGQGSGDE